MLDDLKKIAQVDKSDALGVVAKQAQQLRHEFNQAFSAGAEIRNIVVGGMGGSGWPTKVLTSWPGLNVPFELVNDYQVPEYVNEHTLYVASSFSGNTEESLSALKEALSKGAQVVVMAAGGELEKIAAEKQLPFYKLPSGQQPRMSSLYFLTAFVQLLEPLGIIPKGSLDELHGAADWLENQHEAWLPEVAAADNQAKQIAKELVGKSVVIYSGPKLFPAANKWKIFVNECAKNLAWAYQYPEFNHNEFIGWSSHPIEKPFAVVEIRSNLEHGRTQKRFELSERLLSGKRPAPIVVTPQGDTLLKQILWTFNLGDFVAIYLSILNNVDPTPVDLVEKFKKELG